MYTTATFRMGPDDQWFSARSRYLGFEEFMKLFHGAVSAVENGGVAEVDLDAASETDDDLQINVSIRRTSIGGCACRCGGDEDNAGC